MLYLKGITTGDFNETVWRRCWARTKAGCRPRPSGERQRRPGRRNTDAGASGSLRPSATCTSGLMACT